MRQRSPHEPSTENAQSDRTRHKTSKHSCSPDLCCPTLGQIIEAGCLQHDEIDKFMLRWWRRLAITLPFLIPAILC